MFQRWFSQAVRIKDYEREVDFLTRQLEFAEDRATHAEMKVALLDKSVTSERTKHDKFVAVAMDKLTRNTGAFQKTIASVEKPKPPTYSPEIEIRIMAAAELNRQADIEMDIEPMELEMYAATIRTDPERYLPQ